MRRLYGNAQTTTSANVHGRLHRVQNKVLKSTVHNHVVDAATLESKTAVNSLKQMAKEVGTTTQAIVETISQQVPEAAASQLPSVSCMKRKIQRVRQKQEVVPANPTNLTDLRIPVEFTKNSVGEPFLLFDSGPGEQRILLFSTQKNLELMEKCDH